MEFASEIYFNGTIYTMDKNNSILTHIAIKENKILAVGFDEIKKYADNNTQFINLNNQIVFPGFYDGHSHLMRAGQNLLYFLDISSYPLGKYKTLQEIKQKIINHCTTLSNNEWIVCGGFDETALKESRLFTLQELDEISPNHPLIIRHISGHILLANSLAYKLAGITKETPNPIGGYYRKNVDGFLNGIIEEPIAMEPFWAKALPMDQEKWIKSVEYACNEYVAKGITTAQDGNVNKEMWDCFIAAHKQGVLKCRVQLFPRYPLGYMDLDSFKNTQSGSFITSDGFITLGAVKLIQDGSIQNYTAYLSQPYHSVIYESIKDKKNWHGYPARSRADLIILIKKFHKQGWQIAVHCNGDEAIEDVICAIEEAQKEFPRKDTRHIIMHCQTVRDDQLQRMEQLGIIASFFVVHTYYWGDRHYNIFLGDKRANRIDPLASALSYHIPFTLHNDTFVTPIDPLLSVWSAVNRKTAQGRILGTDQQISVYEAMKAITINGAYQFHEENIKGSLEPNKLADMTILNEDPFKINPNEIKNISVNATIIDGKIVYGKL